MPGLCTPAEAAEARAVIDAAAADAGRTVDGGHFGVNVSWVDGAIDDEVATAIKARRPDLDPADVVGIGTSGLRERIEGFVEVGFTKFVIRPAAQPASWTDAVESVADVLALQT
jgi:alkanesulfonate monooxygenase SsuD/methylene tetrahydromethanopterin reductase-like flavin-dependent oxidoreductase (luciferase family)